MHGEKRHDHDKCQGDRGQARLKTGEERQATEELGRDGESGVDHREGEAHLLEVARDVADAVDEDLLAAVVDEDDADGEAQGGDAPRLVAAERLFDLGLVHGLSPVVVCAKPSTPPQGKSKRMSSASASVPILRFVSFSIRAWSPAFSLRPFTAASPEMM